MIAYRISVGCLFLAFWTAITFQFDRERDEFVKQLKEQMQKIEPKNREQQGQ